jgi:hypothetical protein
VSAPEPEGVDEPPAGDNDVDASYADWRTETVGLASAEFGVVEV